MLLLYIWSWCRGKLGSEEERGKNFDKRDVVEIIGFEMHFIAIVCEAGGSLKILGLWQRMSLRGAGGREGFVG